jgi:hypothetical protein
MNKMKLLGLIGLSIFISSLTVWADDFDGSRPLLFSVISAMECTPDSGCRAVTIESVDLPRFLKIDLDKKTIGPVSEGDTRPESVIERMERVDGKLILQGAEDGYESVRDGLGWTIAISEGTGRVVMTASGDQVAFVVFGACLPL